MQLLSVITPDNLACGVTGLVPLTIQIRNGVAQTQSDVKVCYRIDNTEVVTENIGTLQGKQTLDYTFSKLLDISSPGNHTIDIWLAAVGDTYNKNDSLLDYSVRNQPLITSYPYTEGFEDNDGFWFADGYGVFSTKFVYRPGGILGSNTNWIHTLDNNKSIIVFSNTNATNLYEMSEQLYLISKGEKATIFDMKK